jgi:RNA polymerase sigma factor (sigma-70 family)
VSVATAPIPVPMPVLGVLTMTDRSRAAQAYRELAPAVLGYLRALRVSEPEDVLGEVFLHVVRDIDRFRGDDAHLRRWVFSIAHNRVMDHHRRARRRPQPASGPVPELPGPPPHDPFDPELVGALAALSIDQREVVVLRFVADLSLEAVARVTGRRVGAVKALQHRALENLERNLSRSE